jgi:hypothetical protein
MSNLTITYDRKQHTSQDIVKLHKQGFDVLCPVCHSKLIFITSLEEAKGKAPGHPGIFCPNSPDHVYTTFTMNRRDFWKRFDEKMKKLEKEDQAN